MDEWLERFARANFRRSADTAHDLKTPLNVAVLNLELLRMRLAKLGESGSDEKVGVYINAIEVELRRLARIFDAFFLLSTPPKDEDEPVEIDAAALAREVAAENGYVLDMLSGARVRAHESRMRQAMKLFFEGAFRVFPPDGRTANARSDDDRFELAITGRPEGEDFEMSKIFKLYYTDPAGRPDLSLAAARLIAETYGGELTAVQDREKVVLRLSFPLGAE
jgi:K+-sensing histidine kinase KdpD